MVETICTIGFAKKSLRKFVELLQELEVTKLIDTRLNNTSQLAGFAKKNDLAFIMEAFGIKYIHEPELAPTATILKEFKKKEITWSQYEKEYINLLNDRKILDRTVQQMKGETVCFLCSEDKPHHCHRRLLAEYIQENYPVEITICHLI